MKNLDNFQVIIFISWLALVSCLRRMPQKVRNNMFFPIDLRSPGQTRRPELRVPNEKFCSEMQLDPAEHYMVLPWWYNYCAKMHEKLERAPGHHLSFYRNVLNQLQAYKKNKLREKMLNEQLWATKISRQFFFHVRVYTDYPVLAFNLKVVFPQQLKYRTSTFSNSNSTTYYHIVIAIWSNILAVVVCMKSTKLLNRN